MIRRIYFSVIVTFIFSSTVVFAANGDDRANRTSENNVLRLQVIRDTSETNCVRLFVFCQNSSSNQVSVSADDIRDENLNFAWREVRKNLPPGQRAGPTHTFTAGPRCSQVSLLGNIVLIPGEVFGRCIEYRKDESPFPLQQTNVQCRLRVRAAAAPSEPIEFLELRANVRVLGDSAVEEEQR